MKTIWIFIIILSLPLLLYSQAASECEAYEFIYIDNSVPTVNDGFSDTLVSILLDRLESLKEDTSKRFMVFLSNGENFTSINQHEDLSLEEIRLLLLSNSSEYPRDLVAEKSRIREILLANAIDVKANIKFTYFVSSFFCNRLEAKPSLLISVLPRDFIAANELQAVSAELEVYFADIQDNVEEEKVLENLKFPNQKSMMSGQSTLDDALLTQYKSPISISLKAY